MAVGNARDERGSGQALTMLLWLGVGLASVAVLILLVVPGSIPMRIGAVLGLVAVVLIGLSVPRHRTEGGMAMQALRMLDEKLRALEAEVHGLRGEVARSAAARAGAQPPALARTGAGYPPGFEAPQRRYAIASSAARREHVAEPEYAAAPHLTNGHNGAVSVTQPRAELPSSGRASVPSPSGPRGVATGVVRHTETVRVTTRQTIVEPDADRQNHEYGSVYASARNGWTAPRQRGPRSAEPDRDRSPADAQPGWAEDAPEREPAETRPAREWATGRRLEAGRARSRYETNGAADAGHLHATERENASWRADDRWAVVRDDAEGREVRVGRRRAAVHVDDTGTELRVDDRLAAVRQAYEGHRWADSGDADEGWTDSGDLGERWADARPGDDWSASGRGRSMHVVAAEPVRRAVRATEDPEAYGFPPSDGVANAGRRLGFSRSDARWS